MSSTPQHRTAKRVSGRPTGKTPSQLEKRPAAPGSHNFPGCFVQVSVEDRTVDPSLVPRPSHFTHSYSVARSSVRRYHVAAIGGAAVGGGAKGGERVWP